MDTLEQRVRRVQARREALLLRRQRILTTHLLLLSLAMLGGLLYVITQKGMLHRPNSGTGMAASSLLDSAAGGYILVAVMAFALGTAITLLCRSWIEKRKQEKLKSDGGKNDE